MYSCRDTSHGCIRGIGGGKMKYFLFQIITENSPQKGREFLVKEKTIKQARKTVKQLFPGEKSECLDSFPLFYVEEVTEKIDIF